MPVRIPLPDGRSIDVPDDISPADKAALKEKLRAKYGAGEPAEDRQPEPAKQPTPEEIAGITQENGQPVKEGNFFSDLGKGFERIGGTIGNAFGGDYKDPVRPREVADIGENFVRSMAAPVGGDFVAAGGENIGNFVQGKPINHDAVEQQRARREQLANDNPLTALGGEGLGIVATAGMASNRVNAIMPTASRLTKLVATGAAISGGASAAEGNDTGQVLTDTAVGGLSAPIIDKVVRIAAPGIKTAVKYARSILPGGEQAASELAAQKIAQKFPGTDAQTLQKWVEDFRRTNNRTPSVAEFDDARVTGKLAKLAENNKVVGAAADAAEEANTAALPARARAQIQGTTPELTPDTVNARTAAQAATKTAAVETETTAKAAANKAQLDKDVAQHNQLAEDALAKIQKEMDFNTRLPPETPRSPQAAQAALDDYGNKAMDALSKRNILFPKGMAQLQAKPVIDTLNSKLANAVPGSQEAKRLEATINNITEGKPTFINVRDIDDIRRTVNSMIDKKLIGKDVLDNVVQPIEAQARHALPAYDDFLTSYGQAAQAIEGMSHGAGVMTPKTTPFAATLNVMANGKPAVAAGARAGAKVALSDAAQRAPERTARALVADPRAVEAALGSEAAPIVESSRANTAVIDQAALDAKAAMTRGRTTQKALDANAQAQRDNIASNAKQRTDTATGAAKVLDDFAPDFEATVVNAPADMRADVADIARTRLAQTAGEGPRGANKVQRDLVDNPNTQRRVAAALGDDEARALANTAQKEQKSAAALDQIRPTPKSNKEAADYVKEAVRGAAAAGGAGGPFARINAWSSVFSWFKELGLPPVAAKKTAEMLFEAGRTDEVIDRLMKIGVEKEQLAELANRLAAGTQAYNKDRR